MGNINQLANLRCWIASVGEPDFHVNFTLNSENHNALTPTVVGCGYCDAAGPQLLHEATIASQLTACRNAFRRVAQNNLGGKLRLDSSCQVYGVAIILHCSRVEQWS